MFLEVALVVVSAISASDASRAPALSPFKSAKWIQPEAIVRNGTFAAYRFAFTLDSTSQPCQSATLAIAADTKYWLFLNGELVVFEGGLKRGPTPKSGYYDVLNLGSTRWSFNKPNTIAVLSLFLGRKTVPETQTWWNNEHSDSGIHALLVEGSICGTKIISDAADWKAIPHPAYFNDIGLDQNQNFRASEPDIVFDARIANQAMSRWTSPDFQDSSWPKAIERGSAGDAPWGELVERPIPLFWRSEHRRYDALRVEEDPHDGDGFQGLGAGDIGGLDLNSPLPSGCCGTEAACKVACQGSPVCRAAIWNPAQKACALKGAVRVKLDPKSPWRVFVRAYKMLIGILPYDAQITPTLMVPHGSVASSASGLRIDMQTDSYFTDDTTANKKAGLAIPNNRAAYLVDPSEAPSAPYESLGWLVGHEMRYMVDANAPIELNDLEVGFYESGYGTNLTTPFRSSDEALTTLWQKAQRTLYVNARDNWMDCPDRERSQWGFDAAMDVHQAFYALGIEAQKLSRKWIMETVMWQKVDSSAIAYEPDYAPMSIYSPVPGHWAQELPDQTLQVIAYGFLTYWEHTGDADTMRSVLPAVARYLLSWKVARALKGSLVVPRSCPGKPHAADVQCAAVWDWCDGQSVNCDYAPIDNAWYWWALNSTVRIAKAIGGNVTTEELAEMQRRLADLAEGFDAEFWDPSCDCYRSEEHRTRPGGTEHCNVATDNCTKPDDRANALAIVTGLAPKGRWTRIVDGVLDLEKGGVAFASTAMEKFVLEAMFLAGRHEAAVSRMKKRFGPMITYNLSTLWEHWDVDEQTGVPVAGYNHGWSGGALVLLSKYVAGLKPAASATIGWAEFVVEPWLGVSNISASVATERGEILVQIELVGENVVQVRVTVPDGTIGRLQLPERCFSCRGARGIAELRINGSSLNEWDRIQHRLGPGSWVVEAVYSHQPPEEQEYQQQQKLIIQ